MKLKTAITAFALAACTDSSAEQRVRQDLAVRRVLFDEHLLEPVRKQDAPGCYTAISEYGQDTVKVCGVFDDKGQFKVKTRQTVVARR